MFLLFQTIDFPQRFFETPALVTTTKHSKDDVSSHIDADNNAITEWIEVRIYFYLSFFTTYCQWNSFFFFFFSTEKIFRKLNLFQTKITFILLARRAKSFIKHLCHKCNILSRAVAANRQTAACTHLQLSFLLIVIINTLNTFKKNLTIVIALITSVAIFSCNCLGHSIILWLLPCYYTL